MDKKSKRARKKEARRANSRNQQQQQEQQQQEEQQQQQEQQQEQQQQQPPPPPPQQQQQQPPPQPPPQQQQPPQKQIPPKQQPQKQAAPQQQPRKQAPPQQQPLKQAPSQQQPQKQAPPQQQPQQQPPVPSAGGDQPVAPPSVWAARAARASFAQALQQRGGASQPSGPSTHAAAGPSTHAAAGPSTHAAAPAGSGDAPVIARSPRPASTAEAAGGSLPPSTLPPCTPREAAQPIPEAGDAGTTTDDVMMREIEQTLPSHFPPRPAHGKLGRTIQLVANHFSIEIPNGSVYHYDVDIFSETAKETKVPEQKKYRCLSTKINRIVIELLVKKYRQDLASCIPAFDGRKNLYTRRQFNFQERTFTVDLNEEDRIQKFIIKIQYAATVNLDALHAVFRNRVNTVPQEVLQAIDIVLRHGPSIKLAPVGRSFFRPPGPDEHNALGGGREVWFGYYTSVRPAQWKPMLNVDMSATAFYEPLPLVDFICRFLSDGRREMTLPDLRLLRDNHYVRMNRELKGLRVTVKHLSYPRKYKVVRITRESAKDIRFESEGSEISVAEYFQSRYTRLSHPYLPCVQSGSPMHPVYIPLEMCELSEGQHCRKKLDESQTAEMIKRTAKPPSKRFMEIRQSVRDLVKSSDEYLREFGIKINTEPTQLKGRVLDPPSLLFENNSVSKPREGTWELRGQRFYKPATLARWTVLNLSRFAQDNIEHFIRLLISVGQELGMRIAQPLAITFVDTNRKKMRTVLNEQNTLHKGLEMVVAVITKATNYAEIKQVAETELALRTQCILDNNVVKKCNAALIQNLCQKINAKMGGINSSLLPQEKPRLFQKPVIIIGADVSHPSPGDKIRPSIAACVGSIDSVPSKFHASIRVQIEDSEAKARVEIIKDLKEMIKDLLKAFYHSTRHKPERIVLYRDGVSEGQFLEVRNREVSAIRLACKELSPNENYQPALTFIVVQKRHHTRFMPANDRDGVGKFRNVPPGTIVDSDVTHPLDFDFFLCSHFGIQGTSRPAHYYIVWDDSNFTADELQKLSFYLCHTYARCARSVSIPAPVYYAHLAAFRAKHHITSKLDVSGAASESSAGGGESASTSEYVAAVKVMEAFQNSMYFV